jgi:hypothetical protein
MTLAMADRRLLQTACIIQLVLFGHMVDCRRTTKIHEALRRNSEGSAGANKHPWCNPLSSQQNKTYHFDVELTGNSCKDGACLAIELFRHKTNPVLEVHGGKSWAVRDDGGTLSWSLYSKVSEPNEKKAPGNLKIDLLNDVKSVKFFDATKDPLTPAKLEIEMAPLASAPDNLELEGGLYYNERLLKKGFEFLAVHESNFGIDENHAGELTSEMFKVVEKNATTHESMTRKGLKLGMQLGGLSGGVYVAATVFSQNQYVAGHDWNFKQALPAAVVGAVLGGAAGGVIGLALNATNTVSEVMGGYYYVHGYQIVSASEKIFAKLRCLAEFKECSKNVLVPKQRPCQN